jgi:hypothetical protein
MNIDLPLDGASRERMRPLSRALFNSACAFEALILIAQRERFFPKELADLAGCHGSYSGQLLRRLEGGGLVKPLPRDPSTRNRFYVRLPSPVWARVLSLADDLLDEPNSGTVTWLPT